VKLSRGTRLVGRREIFDPSSFMQTRWNLHVIAGLSSAFGLRCPYREARAYCIEWQLEAAMRGVTDSLRYGSGTAAPAETGRLIEEYCDDPDALSFGGCEAARRGQPLGAPLAVEAPRFGDAPTHDVGGVSDPVGEVGVGLVDRPEPGCVAAVIGVVHFDLSAVGGLYRSCGVDREQVGTGQFEVGKGPLGKGWSSLFARHDRLGRHPVSQGASEDLLVGKVPLAGLAVLGMPDLAQTFHQVPKILRRPSVRRSLARIAQDDPGTVLEQMKEKGIVGKGECGEAHVQCREKSNSQVEPSVQFLPAFLGAISSSAALECRAAGEAMRLRGGGCPAQRKAVVHRISLVLKPIRPHSIRVEGGCGNRPARPPG
jgi:hypothetical protein